MIIALILFGLVFTGTLFALALCRAAATVPEYRPTPGRNMVYCERCEQKTARRLSSPTATVVACSDHTHCGFRRCIRDDVDPQNVRVFHDPGPTKEGQRT